MGIELYNTLPKIIRDKDRLEGGLWLQRFLERPQYWHNHIESLIKTLPDQIDPDKCNAEVLDYLLAIVGFTTRYSSIVSRLSENTKRRLVRLAVPLWKLLYTELGCVEALRILAGKTPYIRTWFDFQAVVGEVLLGEDQVGYDFWVIGTAIARFDEYTSQIRLMDDGLLDETLLLRLLETMRPLNERFEVSLVDFLDVFEEGRSKWTTLLGTPASVTATKTFFLPDGTVEVPSIPIAVDADFTDYVSICKFSISPTGAIPRFNLHFLVEALLGPYYEVQVRPGVLNNIDLTNSLVGVVASGSFPIVANATYKLRARCKYTAGVGTHVVVFVDGNKVIDLHDPLPTPSFGKIRYLVFDATAEIDNVELFRNPLRWATIEPSGTTTSADWVA